MFSPNVSFGIATAEAQILSFNTVQAFIMIVFLDFVV
jgi:hypothetical protein